MAAETSQLQLVTPTQGTLTGAWGNTVNNGITEYVNIAIAGTLSFAGDGAITLVNTVGNSSSTNFNTTTAQYMVIRITGTQTVTKVITGPSYSKLYMVDHAGATSAVTFKAAGQTGVSVAVGEKCFVYYNGTDYVKVASSVADGVTSVAGTGTVNGITLTGTVTSTGSLTLGGTLSGVDLTSQVTGTLPIANGGTGTSSTTFANLATNVTGTLPVANGGTGTATPNLVQGTNVTITGTWPNQTINAAGAAQVYPGAGIAVSTGSAWTTSKTSPSGDIVGTTDTQTLTNKTLVAPLLGTPTSGTLSACTVDGTDAVGFRNIPQNSESVDYTLVLADSGKHIFHPSTDANARTFTIPANSSVAYPIGTAISFVNMSANNVTIAITTDTMYSSAGTTGSRTLAQYGSATALKMTSTTWLITGSNLT